jgi:anti-sigma B factor antagonist
MGDPNAPDVAVRRDGEECVVTIEGEIDVANADRLAATMLDGVEVSPVTVIDVSGCDFMDSAGIRALTQGLRRFEEAGSEVRLVVAPRGSVRRVLDITAITEQFPFAEANPA